METKNVYLALPTYDGRIAAKSVLSIISATADSTVRITPVVERGSVLPFVFNTLWCNAIVRGFPYFVMLHSDVTPESGWIDTLLSELLRLDADVVSVVIPEKSTTGRTSTAVDGEPLQPLSIRQVLQLPATFSSADVGGPLLINTGCWIANIARPWAKQITFGFEHRVTWPADGGKPSIEATGEDWGFSRQLHALGVKGMYATRKVRVEHHGEFSFNNFSAWGS